MEMKNDVCMGPSEEWDDGQSAASGWQGGAGYGGYDWQGGDWLEGRVGRLMGWYGRVGVNDHRV